MRVTHTAFFDVVNQRAQAALTGAAPPALGGKLLTHLKIIAKCFVGDALVTVDEDTAEFLILSKASASGEASLIDSTAVLNDDDADEPQYEFEWNPADSVQLRAVLDAAADPTAPVELRYEFRFERDGEKGCIGGPIYFLNNFFRPETPAPEATLNTSWTTLKARVLAGANLTRTIDDALQTMTFDGEDSEANAAAIAAHVADLGNPHQVSFAQIGGTPTTLAGYGITDAITAALAASTYEPIIGVGTLALNKLATDPLARANHTGTQAWSTITGVPTTLAGYGITDAITAAAAAAAYQPLDADLTAWAAWTPPTNAAGVLRNNGSGTLSWLSTTTGGNGASDNGKLAIFGADGSLRSATAAYVFNPAHLTRYAALQPNEIAWVNLNGGGTAVFLSPPASPSGSHVWTLPDAAGTLLLSNGSGASLTALNASALASGTVPTARLGTGTADATTFLRGDGTWQAAGGGGLTIGSTAITGGTSGRILYNNGDVVGEMTGIVLTSGALSALTAAAGTIASSAPGLTISQTWNGTGGTGGTAFSAIVTDITDTSSSNGLTNTSWFHEIKSGGATRGGFRNYFGGLACQVQYLEFQDRYNAIAGQSGTHIIFRANDQLTAAMYDRGLQFDATTGLHWSATTSYSASAEVSLYRLAAQNIILRSGTTATAFHVANTYTSATNWEAGVMDWKTTANTLRLGTDVGSGGGSSRAMDLITGGVARIKIGAAGELGFFGASAVAKPEVTGSAASNAALASLLTALANLGLITDSSS